MLSSQHTKLFPKQNEENNKTSCDRGALLIRTSIWRVCQGFRNSKLKGSWCLSYFVLRTEKMVRYGLSCLLCAGSSKNNHYIMMQWNGSPHPRWIHELHFLEWFQRTPCYLSCSTEVLLSDMLYFLEWFQRTLCYLSYSPEVLLSDIKQSRQNSLQVFKSSSDVCWSADNVLQQVWSAHAIIKWTCDIYGKHNNGGLLWFISRWC
jgi:hypothetical protein